MRAIRLLVIVAAAILLTCHDARAFCLGVGPIAGRGGFDFEVKPYLQPAYDVSGDMESNGVRVLIDYSCEQGAALPFRVAVGYVKNELKSGDFRARGSFDHIRADFTFPFTLYSGSTMRLWLGPMVSGGHVEGTGTAWMRDVAGTSVGVGLEAGTSFHLGTRFELCFSAGGRADVYNDAYQQFSSRGILSGSSSSTWVAVELLFRLAEEGPEP